MAVLRDVLQESDDRLTDHAGLGVMTRIVSRDLVDGDAYEEVLRKLVNVLRFLRAWRTEWVVPTTRAISKARIRLGMEPLRELFRRGTTVGE